MSSMGLLIMIVAWPFGAALANPEGTRNVGNMHGLLPQTLVRVDATAGEVLEFCSSDDGINGTESIHPTCLGSPEACADEPNLRLVITQSRFRSMMYILLTLRSALKLSLVPLYKA